VIVTLLVPFSVRPPESVAVAVTVNSPDRGKMCDTLAPVVVGLPSPKSH